MTEEEWLACSDPRPMLEFLRGKVSERKLRLFACGCCRRIWSLIVGDRGRRALQAAEEYADQACSWDRLKKEWDAEGVTAVGHAIDGATAMDAAWGATWAATNVVEAETDRSLRISRPPTSGDIRAWRITRLERQQSSDHAERNVQATLLRDIFGNPFRPVTFDSSWRTLSVVGLAQTIYDERAFQRMSDLADALERAGCRDEAILKHCREPVEHVRGCWAIDLVLGKE